MSLILFLTCTPLPDRQSYSTPLPPLSKKKGALLRNRLAPPQHNSCANDSVRKRPLYRLRAMDEADPSAMTTDEPYHYPNFFPPSTHVIIGSYLVVIGE
ncbi:hypothetical protein TNIN_406201 [Trichonephila inaurata madagascariensis]|uniref:Uncharacterized protein n=1 Tax=Trichonephila inaurata madagascariensis TaxID=2747483 RepID=A0A8X6XHZ5_9ARAC|nr:hypothetical protein TNIN_406201 [Trichonephila inaurata madagascariensis]